MACLTGREVELVHPIQPKRKSLGKPVQRTRKKCLVKPSLDIGQGTRNENLK